MPSAAPSSEQRAARLLQSTYRELILARRCAAYERACALRDAAEAAAEAVANDKRQAEARLLRSPWRRVWPFAREAICIMLLAASLTLAPPPVSAPPAMAVRSIDPTWKQLRAALLGALCINALLLSVLFALLALLARGWHRTLSTVFTLIIGGLLGGPGALLLLRCCEAAHVPLDATSLCMLSGNIVAPCTAVFLMPPQVCRPPTFLLRRIYVAASSALLAWTFSVVPWRGSHSARTRHRLKAHTVPALATASRLTQCPHSPHSILLTSACARCATGAMADLHGERCARCAARPDLCDHAALTQCAHHCICELSSQHCGVCTVCGTGHDAVLAHSQAARAVTLLGAVAEPHLQDARPSSRLTQCLHSRHRLKGHTVPALSTAHACPLLTVVFALGVHCVCAVCALCVRCVCAVCALCVLYRHGLELLIGDFFAYATLGFYAARMGFSLLVAAVLGVALGLTITMYIISSAPLSRHLTRLQHLRLAVCRAVPYDLRIYTSALHTSSTSWHPGLTIQPESSPNPGPPQRGYEIGCARVRTQARSSSAWCFQRRPCQCVSH
jgi:hypothetical protein